MVIRLVRRRSRLQCVTDLTPLRIVAVGRLFLVDLSVELDVKSRELSRRRPPENLEMLGLSARCANHFEALALDRHDGLDRIAMLARAVALMPLDVFDFNELVGPLGNLCDFDLRRLALALNGYFVTFLHIDEINRIGSDIRQMLAIFAFDDKSMGEDGRHRS